MQNPVPSAEVASASIRGPPCYECHIWNGFTSALRLVLSVQVAPHLDIDFPLWQTLFESLARNGALVGFRMAFVPLLRF